MAKIAVVLYGPPGSGKGTQATLLVDKIDLVHVNTGIVVEHIIHDPNKKNDPVIKRERRLFREGKLLTPSWVASVLQRKIKQLKAADEGVVFSGSPRTLYEAKRLVPVLNHFYGKKNLYFFVIDVPPKTSLLRNSSRLLCSFCGVPVLTAYYPTKKPTECPRCGAKLYKRVLDKPEIIATRLKEYKERTEPVFDFLKQQGYKVHSINGELPPYRVFQKIYAYIHKNARRN